MMEKLTQDLYDGAMKVYDEVRTASTAISCVLSNLIMMSWNLVTDWLGGVGGGSRWHDEGY